jgi:hypothetical protein
MTGKPTLRDWFFFGNRQQHSPIKPSVITTHALIEHRTGPITEIGSSREEWLIRSVLVDADAVKDVRHPADPHVLDFSPSWEDDPLRFDFGDHFRIVDTDAYPFIITRTHPISDQLEVELRPDFRWYHFLPQTGGEFKHPLDDVVVATVNIDSHAFFNPTPRVTVHPDYLRDYLAARGYALVVAVVADRFATRANLAELEIETTQDAIEIDKNARIRLTINEENGRAWGRSSLYWSMVVEPYDRPRPQRSAWHFFGDMPDDGAVTPTFIIDAQGTRGTAKQAGLGYLYFKREVLRKYLDAPGYSVYFHMRTWGAASTPLGSSVDVGVNEEHLVTAFAPDIAELSVGDQAYWSSFSVVPSGGVCWELFETRMQQRPPHSPSLPELITKAIGDLNDAFRTRYGSDLYRTKHERLPSHRHLSVGPVTENMQEFLDLAKVLYTVTVEDIDEKAIKNALPVNQRPKKEENLRSIALMERLLQTDGHEDGEIRALTNMLRALRNLRVIEAHVLSSDDVLKEFKSWGVTTLPASRRVMWHVAVDAMTKALHEIAAFLRKGPIAAS